MNLHDFNIRELHETFELDRYSSLLRRDYENYTTEVSTRSMAASLICCSYFLHLIEIVQPKTVIDFGSGFSSFAIRKYIKTAGEDIKSISVDSDKVWLEKSKQYCIHNEVSSDNFYTWKDVPKQSADLIFFDIDMTKKRLGYFKPLFKDFCHDQTIILFDDMHKPVLKERLFEEMKHLKGCEFHDTEQITKDGRRFSYLLQVRK